MKNFDIHEIEQRVKKVFRNRYRVIGPLGEGGMGGVFCVESTDRFPVRHALKVLKRKNRFKGVDLFGEVQMLRQLNHPSIPRIIEAPEDEDYIYILQELVEGVSLREVVETQGPLDVETAQLWMSDVADALAYLHEHRVIHRDIKPTNIMVTAEGVIKVIDFGLAKWTEEVDYADKRLLGTKEYTPPERYAGAPATEQTDIYEYGTTFYMLLTGESPLVMSTNARRHMQAMRHNIDRIPSAGLQAILKRCIDVKPERRYRSFNEILYQLQTLDAFEQAVKQTEKKRKIRKKLTIGTLSLGVILLCLGVYLTGAIHNNKYEQLIEKADSDYDQAMMKTALDKYREAKEFDPGRPEGYVGEYTVRLANLKSQKLPEVYGDLAEEIDNDIEQYAFLEESASMWTQKGETLYYAAESSENNREKRADYCKDAIDAYEKALERDPDEDLKEDIYFAEVYTYTLMGEYEAANRVLKEHLSDTNDDNKKYLDAYIMEHQGKSDEAVRIYEKLISTTDNPELKEKAITQAGALYMKNHQNEEAVRVLKKGDQQDYTRNVMLLDAYYQGRKYEAAIRQADVVLNQNDCNENAYEKKICAQLEQFRYEEVHTTIAAYARHSKRQAAFWEAYAYATEISNLNTEYESDPGLCDKFLQAYERAEYPQSRGLPEVYKEIKKQKQIVVMGGSLE